MRYNDDENMRFLNELDGRADAFLFGRRTFKILVSARPATTILALVQFANGQEKLAAKIWATSALPVLGGNQFTIYLNIKAPVSIQVAWFVLG